MNFSRFQHDLEEWLNHNFPNTTSDQQLKGVMEEVKELLEAEQVFLNNPPSKENKQRVDDAVGDIIVYLCNYCNMKRIDFAKCVGSSVREQAFCSGDVRQLMIYIGRICHADLKWEQGIRGYDREKAMSEIEPAITGIYDTLECYCAAFSTDVTDCAKVAYAEIMKRDWIKNPETGQ